MEKISAELLKKYHQDLVFNYSEYPTKDHWSFSFTDSDYRAALLDWIPQNPDKKIFFYVHIPFCEELCYFCTCSKFITKDYQRVSDYLKYLHREIDILFDFLKENDLQLNVGTVFFGGGSPTILSKPDLEGLVTKLRGLFDWDSVEFFTIETDPRRVDEERLIYNADVCGANRISFGLQDFDPTVQRLVNRIQPVELFEAILTPAVRERYKEIAVDLLIGQPAQTVETMAETCDKIIRLQPSLVQLSLMAFKPWVAKYQSQMLAEGPLPDFFERKLLLDVIHKKFQAAGYIRTGFECYSLPSSPMTKAFEEGQAHYGASGHQTGGKVNFIAVGSSSMSNLGDCHYAQNFYDIESYKRCLGEGNLPTFRGMTLSVDDKIRQHATQCIRSYFSLSASDFKERYSIKFDEYFRAELEMLLEYEADGLLHITSEGVMLTDIGRDFVQNIMNVFDRYDPPGSSTVERLSAVKQAKQAQKDAQNRIHMVEK